MSVLQEKLILMINVETMVKVKHTQTRIFEKLALGCSTLDLDHFTSFCRSYELLNVFEFNSSRKRKSVIVKDEEGKLLLLSKGADRFVNINLKLLFFRRPQE